MSSETICGSDVRICVDRILDRVVLSKRSRQAGAVISLGVKRRIRGDQHAIFVSDRKYMDG